MKSQVVNKKKIALIIPVHNEEGCLHKLYGELESVTCGVNNYAFAYNFINDGSTDNSLDVLRDLSVNDSKITVIDLSRNFGKEIATTAGLCNIDKDIDAVIIMDSDLQHPPQYIPEFIAKWEEGYDIVATKRSNVEDSRWLKKICSHLFYSIMNRISDVKMVSQTTDFRLLNRYVIDRFSSFTERQRVVRGLIDWMGFKKTYIEFNAPERFAGNASYGYRSLFRLALNSILAYSNFPLKVSAVFGCFLSILASLSFGIALIDYLFFDFLGVRPSVFFVLANSVFLGAVLIMLSVLALYIRNIHEEVLSRPLYLIREIINSSVSENSTDNNNENF